VASRMAGTNPGRCPRQAPISSRASSLRPLPSAARARSSSGTPGQSAPSKAVMPRSHGCSPPSGATSSTMSATRPITSGSDSHAAGTAVPSASAATQLSTSAAASRSTVPHGPSSHWRSNAAGMPDRSASDFAALSSPARSAAASCLPALVAPVCPSTARA
jgi:hypothetical protein